MRSLRVLGRFILLMTLGVSGGVVLAVVERKMKVRKDKKAISPLLGVVSPNGTKDHHKFNNCP